MFTAEDIRKRFRKWHQHAGVRCLWPKILSSITMKHSEQKRYEIDDLSSRKQDLWKKKEKKTRNSWRFAWTVDGFGGILKCLTIYNSKLFRKIALWKKRSLLCELQHLPMPKCAVRMQQQARWCFLCVFLPCFLQTEAQFEVQALPFYASVWHFSACSPRCPSTCPVFSYIPETWWKVKWRL